MLNVFLCWKTHHCAYTQKSPCSHALHKFCKAGRFFVRIVPETAVLPVQHAQPPNFFCSLPPVLKIFRKKSIRNGSIMIE